MKFKHGILALSAFAFVACNPLEDIYQQIDKDNDPSAEIVKTYEEYVLTESDYVTISKAAAKAAGDNAELKAAASAVATELALNEYVTKDKYIPAIVSSLVPTWQKGSVVNVTYNYSHGLTENEIAYANVADFSVSDYGADNSFFTPSNSAEDNVPAALAAQFPEAKEGDKVAVSYKYSAVDPNEGGEEEQGDGDDEQTVTLPATGFDDQTAESNVAIEGWKNINTKGDYCWFAKSYSDNFYAQMSAYNAAEGEVEAWLIMPKTKIEDGMSLTFMVKYGYPSGDAALKIMVSEDYSGGDAVDGTWSDISANFSFPALPESGYSEWESVGNGDLSAFAGKDVYVAFCYTGNKTTGATTTFQIDDLAIQAADAKTSAKAAVEVIETNGLYEFDGTEWAASSSSDVVLLAAADYDAMGDGPGKYNNFSSSVAPINYLPTFLALNNPYAQVGDTKAVIYKYYGAATPYLVDEYIFNGTSWVVNINIELCEKETFINADGTWMFDPTILYTLANDDYTMLVDWVKENKPSYKDPKYDNSEWWFGSSYHYNNYNVQLVKRRSYDADGILTDMSDPEAEEWCDQQIFASLTDVILPAKFSSVSSVDAAGNDQIIRVSCAVYNGANVTYVIDLKVLGGNKYEYVSHVY